MAQILSFLLSWQIRSCSILDTSKITPFYISVDISQLKVTCFSTAADRLLSQGILLKASCMSSRLYNLTVLCLLELTSLIKDLMLAASSPKPLQVFFLKKSSSIYERTNYLFYFSFKDYESLFFFSYSVARKAFCRFTISTLLLQIPNNSCNIASYVHGVSRGVTTSSFLSVINKITLSSLGQSLGFFINSSSNFFDTLLAIQAQTSDQLTYLTCGSTLRDMATEMRPSDMR